MNTQSQTEGIHAMLKTGKSITPIEALEKFGCMRLGARIYDIKRRHNAEIETKMVYKDGKRFASYSLKQQQ